MAGQSYGEDLKPGERAPAMYAASAIPSRGREFPEPPCPTRSPFQRDRDRIIHSTPFRRLLHKTQVFVYHEGDHYRTRLTHSLEVAQIARTIARQLRLDEDLAEALALAHDLGHSPFGHAGERALDRVMAEAGGFDHNAQSLKMVMRLERKYSGFDGLNLTWESLEGLAKHNGPVASALRQASNTVVEELALAALPLPEPEPAVLKAGADTPSNRVHPVAKVAALLHHLPDLALSQQASAEAQVAALADDIAYVSHDVDDGLRAGLLSIEALSVAPLVDKIAARAMSGGFHSLDTTRAIYEIIRSMITLMVSDCVEESRRRLARLAPQSPDEIRAADAPVVAFSGPVADAITSLKRMLFRKVYRHERVMRVMSDAEALVEALYGRYVAAPDEMPEVWRAVARGRDGRRLKRLVGDFVSGMTDRMALAEHRRLFDATPDLR